MGYRGRIIAGSATHDARERHARTKPVPVEPPPVPPFLVLVRRYLAEGMDHPTALERASAETRPVTRTVTP